MRAFRKCLNLGAAFYHLRDAALNGHRPISHCVPPCFMGLSGSAAKALNPVNLNKKKIIVVYWELRQHLIKNRAVIYIQINGDGQ